MTIVPAGRTVGVELLDGSRRTIAGLPVSKSGAAVNAPVTGPDRVTVVFGILA